MKPTYHTSGQISKDYKTATEATRVFNALLNAIPTCAIKDIEQGEDYTVAYCGTTVITKTWDNWILVQGVTQGDHENCPMLFGSNVIKNHPEFRMHGWLFGRVHTAR